MATFLFDLQDTRLSANDPDWKTDIMAMKPDTFREECREAVNSFPAKCSAYDYVDFQLGIKGRKSKEDMSHVIATANGGAQAAENVVGLPHKINLALSDKYDHVMAAIVADSHPDGPDAGEEFVQEAISLSRKYGNVDSLPYKGSNARTLCKRGRDALESGKAPHDVCQWWKNQN